MTSLRFTGWSMGEGVLFNPVFIKWRHCVSQNLRKTIKVVRDQNNCPDGSSDFDTQIDFIIDLDDLDTWQHESTWVYFFWWTEGGYKRVFWRGLQVFLDKYWLFNIDYSFFWMFFYVFSQVDVSKYLIYCRLIIGFTITVVIARPS